MSLSPIEELPEEGPVAESEGPFREENGVVVIEAEHFEDAIPYRGQSWERSRTIRGHRGQAAVVAGPDQGIRIRGRYEGSSPELTYRIAFSEPGIYYVWLRAWAEDDNGNSVHLGLNGRAHRTAAGIETQSYGEWTWTRTLMDEREPASLRVDNAGSATLNLWMREDGFYVDRILLTTDRSYVPSENGPNESGRQNRPPSGRSQDPAVTSSTDDRP
jgi:hypothetical protein